MDVLDHYPTDPGVCRVCGTDTVPTVWTEVFFEEHGVQQALYLCAGCVGTMADTLGWVRPEKIAKAEGEASRLKGVASVQGKRAAELDRVLSGFVQAGKFQVSPEFYDVLSEDDKARVLDRLSKKVAEQVKASEKAAAK